SSGPNRWCQIVNLRRRVRRFPSTPEGSPRRLDACFGIPATTSRTFGAVERLAAAEGRVDYQAPETGTDGLPARPAVSYWIRPTLANFGETSFLTGACL